MDANTSKINLRQERKRKKGDNKEKKKKKKVSKVDKSTQTDLRKTSVGLQKNNETGTHESWTLYVVSNLQG